MRGRVDQGFITQINKEFVCLIATVIQYGLKTRSLGEHKEPGKFQGIVPKGTPQGLKTRAKAGARD